MKRSLTFFIIFLFSIFVFLACQSGYFFTFYYTVEEGDDYYHSKVTENIFILNYMKNIKSINYCFTDEDKCNDYLVYEGDLSKRILNVAIDYPDSSDGKRICIKIVSSNSNSVYCNNSIYVVDSLKPVINSLYDEIIINGDNENLEALFEVNSNTGIRDFNCEYIENDGKNSRIECRAVGNNTLESVYSKNVYINNNSKLENKKILFVGDSITEAKSKYDDYSGWAGRIGLGNSMEWKNVGISGATIAKTSRDHITDQIIDNKDENFDYIILQGGINDMSKEVSLGEISDSFNIEDFDNTTYAGGLEELFYYTKKYNSESRIGFIITYQTPNCDWGGMVADRSSQVELTRKICEKWDIPYLDLYDGVVYEDGKISNYSDILKVATGEYFYKERMTEVHLSSSGYDVISKYIAIWIKTL